VAHGYWILFATMLVEGPVVTFAAGFAAALGYFNIIGILILSFFGDFVSDLVYYSVGYWGRMRIVERYGHRLGLTRERMEKIESALKHQVTKSLVILKFVPVLPTFGLIAAGGLRIPLKKFLKVVTLVIIPRTLLFGLGGFYFGRAYKTILPAAARIEDGILTFMIGAAVIYGIYRLIARHLVSKADL